MRRENLTPEKLEKERAYRRRENMTPERLERERAYRCYANLTPEKQERERQHARRSQSNRRALKLGSRGQLSPNIRETLFTKQCGQCVYCRMDLTTVTPHLDHRMPLALGGTHTDDNVQLLCPTCNLSKHNQHPDEYEARIGYQRQPIAAPGALPEAACA